MRRRPRATAAVLLTSSLAAAVVLLEMGDASSTPVASKPAAPLTRSADPATLHRIATLRAELARAGADASHIKAEIAALQAKLARARAAASAQPVFSAPIQGGWSSSPAPVAPVHPSASGPTYSRSATPTTAPTSAPRSSEPPEDPSTSPTSAPPPEPSSTDGGGDDD